jgi:hypothetical protein
MKKNLLKITVAALVAFGINTAQAQQVTGTRPAIEKVGKSSLLNGTVRVIDNKGTKKYLQVRNGLTLFTDQTPDGGIVSTWQLGGTLTNNTYIDATGQTFSLDGLELTTSAAATSATNNSVGSNKVAISGSGTATTDTGVTALVRDEATGKIQKMLISDFVKSGQLAVAATTDGTAPTLADASIPAVYQKVFVFRNGAKLLANVDYTVAAGAVTLVPQTTAPNDWEIYAGDVFEVQWVN